MKLPSTIQIHFIDQSDQRYGTCGDYFYDGDRLVIKVSKTRDVRSQLAVTIHELTEMLLCIWHGVEFAEIDEFDKDWEEAQLDVGLGEPGDDPNAPYHREHTISTVIEMIVCRELGLTWRQHEQNIDELFDQLKKEEPT